MKIQELKADIVHLSKTGLKSRQIANILGISKSSVNYALQETRDNLPKILIFDLETAATLAYTFGRFKVNLSQDSIYKEGGWILCASYRWLGESKSKAIWLTAKEVENSDDSRIVAKLFELYEQADAVVAHNSLGFDHKVVQTRALANNFPALPKVKVLDTLQIAKNKLKLSSNSLDAVAAYFGLGRKVSTSGISLWADVQAGDREAMKDMVDYCVHDTDLLYDVYDKLRHLDTAINFALYTDDENVICNACGSDNVKPTGRTVKTNLSVFDEVRCGDCGAVHRTRKNKTSKSKRSTLLA